MIKAINSVSVTSMEINSDQDIMSDGVNFLHSISFKRFKLISWVYGRRQKLNI